MPISSSVALIIAISIWITLISCNDLWFVIWNLRQFIQICSAVLKLVHTCCHALLLVRQIIGPIATNWIMAFPILVRSVLIMYVQLHEIASVFVFATQWTISCLLTWCVQHIFTFSKVLLTSSVHIELVLVFVVMFGELRQSLMTIKRRLWNWSGWKFFFWVCINFRYQLQISWLGNAWRLGFYFLI